MKRIAQIAGLALLGLSIGFCFGQSTSTKAAASVLPSAPAPQLTNLYGAGAAFAPGTGQPYAATAFEAHLMTGNTYTFTDFIMVPTKVSNTVTNADGTTTTTTQTVFSKNIGVGIAQKLFDLGKYPVYTTGTAGPSWTGSDTTWQFQYGVTVPIRIKTSNFFVMPVITGNSSGNGTQAMYQICFAYGK